MNNSLLFDELQEKIDKLGHTTWYDRKINWPQVEKWLNQFNADLDPHQTQLQFLFLLSQFTYFGRREIREMLKSVYRDLFKYPLVEEIRKNNSNTKDRTLIDEKFIKQLEKTRFLGIGNPSESGTHLLYFFRQENGLSKKLFINGHEIYKRTNSNHLEIREPGVDRYVFLDDLSGSGKQAKDYSKNLVELIKKLNPDVTVVYYTLFCTKKAKDHILKNTKFDTVQSIFELDESFECFSDESRCYAGEKAPIDRISAKALCEKYDKNLLPGFELGYKASQLLIGFYHNTPDNAPPIFWYEGLDKSTKTHWSPIFHRYHKIY